MSPAIPDGWWLNEAKPILDFAAGLNVEFESATICRRLEELAWEYRGDAGGSVGQLFVLETRPRHRVAHLHAVEHGGTQWLNYLALRDMLRGNTAARASYASIKTALQAQFPHDRRSYTAGKDSTVQALLRG